ncbi:MAG: ATP-binding protein [Myxococcota bacterium]|nr:ATP-binding protein [Myxococcota bacterium]
MVWTTIAALARVALDPLLEHEAALVFVAGVVGAAWWGGLGPGLLATGKSALVSIYFFIPPEGFSIEKTFDRVAIVLFVVIGAVTSVLGEARRRALLRARDAALRTSEALTARDASLASEKAARARAEDEARLKDEFLATLSHELRTPLNAMMGWLSLIEHDPSSELAPRAHEVIGRNGRALAHIVEDLLDASSLLAGKLRLDAHAVDLRAPVLAAVETIEVGARAARVELVSELASQPLMLLGDPTRLQQIAWNLLSNAVKFTPPGGRVVVRLSATDGMARLVVTDDGIGIEAAFLPHVFERLRQYDQSSTRRHGGLGIGLAIVQDLVEAHGGRVEARSEGAGRGATFTVSLPLTEAPAPRATITPPA